jgi:putative toxin-antitoxin system antitoxin component (TIGR02293 family)
MAEAEMTAATVAAKLGGRRVLKREVRSELDLAALVREGLPVAALEFLARRLMAGEIYRLIGSPRTLQRKRAAGTRLSPDESDRLTRVARLIARAEEALGDPATAIHWLRRENRALGGVRPLQALDSDAGALAVERVLGRIEHGVYS